MIHLLKIVCMNLALILSLQAQGRQSCSPKKREYVARFFLHLAIPTIASIDKASYALRWQERRRSWGRVLIPVMTSERLLAGPAACAAKLLVRPVLAKPQTDLEE